MGDNFQREIKLLPVCALSDLYDTYQLSHTVGISIHFIGFITCETCKIDLYTVLISAVDGEILLLPDRVRHVENARALLPTL